MDKLIKEKIYGNLEPTKWKRRGNMLLNFFGRFNRSNPTRVSKRPLIGDDATSHVALAMSDRQREVYFRCVDMAIGAGFDYHSGSMGGGSMSFEKTGVVRQEITLYVGKTEQVNLHVRPAHSFKKEFSRESVVKIGEHASDLVQDFLRTLLRLKPDEVIDLGWGPTCIVRIGEDYQSCTLESNFNRIRSHLAMALDLCDEVDQFAATVSPDALMEERAGINSVS